VTAGGSPAARVGPTTTRHRPIIFGSEPGLLGILTTADERSERCDRGIVICAPFGHPNINAYRPLEVLARRIAASGTAVLRFDWPGTGDSGDPESDDAEGVVQRWTGAIAEAVDALRANVAVDRVGLIGLRIGATLALLAAEADPTLTEIGLLGPYIAGRQYLSEARAFHALARDTFSEPDFVPPQLPDGSIESSGFLISPEEVAAFRSLDLSNRDLSPFASRRVLLISAQAERRVDQFVDRLAAAHADVRAVVVPELTRAWDRTDVSMMTREVSTQVCDWLAETASEGPRTASRGVHPLPERTIDARGCRERPVVIDEDGEPLIGILAEPSGEVRQPGDWVIFLNAGRVRRIGPNRLVTTYAREWARAGLPSLRIDLGGLGDSAGDRFPDETPFDRPPRWVFNPSYPSDIRKVIEWLVREQGARRFTIVGLCSGAMWGFGAALADTRIVGVALMNPAVLFDDGRKSPIVRWAAVRRRALRPRSWPVLLKRRPRRSVVGIARGAAFTLSERVDVTWERDRILEAAAQLHAQGTLASIVFVPGDPGIDYFKRYLGPDFAAVLAGQGVRLDTIQGPDHLFRPLWSHDLLRAALETHLRSIGFLDHPASEIAAMSAVAPALTSQPRRLGRRT
jgi:pimeloyl-ACP methyl ester carboxylesterase